MPGAVGELLGAVAGLPPAVFAVAGAVALLVVILVGAWVRERWRTPADRLARAMARRQEITVLLHPDPDPDAMSSGMAVASIAESVGTEATVQYPGRIRHRENLAFVDALDAPLDRIEDVNGLASREIVLVDHNEARGFAGAGGVDPFAVVDHHPGGGTGSEHTDVRTEYGACATILTEYLRDRGWTTADLPTTLATGLLHGIQSDTDGLTRGCCDAEFDASAFLHRAADPALLARVTNPPIDAETMDVRARAIANRRVEGPFLVSDVGGVSNTDAIAGAAEEVIRLAGITAAVVYGEHDGTLHVSGRSVDGSVHVGDALRHAVDDIPMAEAGGHARMGGGQLSVDHMRGIGPGDGITHAEFERLVLMALADELDDAPETLSTETDGTDRIRSR